MEKVKIANTTIMSEDITERVKRANIEGAVAIIDDTVTVIKVLVNKVNELVEEVNELKDAAAYVPSRETGPH